MSNRNNKRIERSKVCPKCGYNIHDGENDTNCEICGTFLPVLKRFKDSKHKNIGNKNSRSLPEYSPSIFHTETKAAKWWSLTDKSFNLKEIFEKCEVKFLIQEIKKPFNLLGVFILGLSIVLWIDYFAQTSKIQSPVASKVNEPSLELSSIPPEGLYSYGGAPIFAPLVANGMNGAIESKYPEFELRYTKPWNQDYSSKNGIKMLLNGELSFAYNERALTEEEYQEALLRNIDLRQVPIAIDGVIIFGNNGSKVTNLSKKQLMQIFRGEITDWKSINPNIKSSLIVPVVVQKENLQILGINDGEQINPNTKYVPNYTQGLRKVIATPGAISFASASLIQDQKLIKIFKIADGNSNYISPIEGNDLNLQDFKSGKYPLTRRVFLVYREDETPDRMAAEAYISFVISDEGQFIVDKSGFVRLY